MLNGLDLFSGIGGISVALRDYVRPIAYCEIDPYCQAVLLSRMVTGDMVHAPIWDDIKSLRIRPQEIDIDIIYGGFPCQDISVAGKGKGLEGERSGLFFEIIRLAKEIKPSFIFLENVPAITSRGGLRVVREITEMGYDCRWCVISAASVGALHRRERWFLLAHAKHNGTSSCKERGGIGECTTSWEESREQEKSIGKIERTSGISSYVADSSSVRCDEGASQGICEKREAIFNEEFGDNCSPFGTIEQWQQTVSEMGKCSHGIPDRVARLRAMGNAVVPIQVKEAFEILMGIK